MRSSNLFTTATQHDVTFSVSGQPRLAEENRITSPADGRNVSQILKQLGLTNVCRMQQRGVIENQARLGDNRRLRCSILV